MNVIKISFDVITVGKSKKDNKILEDILAILSNHPSIDNISVKKNNKVDNTSDIEEYEDKEYSTELVLKDDNNIDEVSLIDETDDNRLMDISISDLKLSTRAYNVLSRNYKNLYELSHITIEDLLEMRELGVVTIKEIVDKLYDNGVYIEHNTIKNIRTGKVRYTSKYDNTVYKIWKLI